jgi:hypothetical protein
MRVQLGAAIIFLLPQTGFAQGQAQGACEQAAFAAVVSDASGMLAAMNEDNKKAFQARLAALKAREGWADGDYAARATPFVKDSTTAALDENNKALLEKVPLLGGAGEAAPEQLAARRCAMLDELRGLMGKVVENTKAKWAHMLGKLDAVLTAPREAKTAGR